MGKIIKIRQSVFETNSSSTHSLTICNEDQYKQLKEGKLLISWDGILKAVTEENSQDDEITTLDNYLDDECLDIFETSYTTKSGDKIIIFGKYGQDC